MEVTKPFTWRDMDQVHFEFGGPWFQELFDVTENTIRFNGYFRFDEELFQQRVVHRLLYFQNHDYFIEIIGKKTITDTSQYSYDEDLDMDVCLTPTQIIELTYRVLEKDPTRSRIRQIIEQIKEEEDELRKISCRLRRNRGIID